MESFHWDKYYLTDLQMVDEQHKRLVDIINEYGSLLSEDKLNAVSIEKVFKELFDYTLYHFEEEEQLMKTMDVDERHIGSHIKNHKYFLDEITRMHDSLLVKNTNISDELLDFLVHWLAYHILGKDQNMARQIKNIEAGQTPAEAFEEDITEGNNAREALLFSLNTLFDQVSQRNRDLLESNLLLEKIVLERTKELQEANDKKDSLLFQQSKMASMGEMIGNITHQWRQPISIISMWANNIIVDIDLGNTKNKQLREYAENINEQTQYLSHTIDDFRNFYIPNKNKSTFTLKYSVDKTMSLLRDLFKTHNIELIENIEDIEITALENELTQAMLNILKNAKDILITLPQESRKLIFIDIYKKNNRVFIEIKDNGGGIPKNIIDKVFESYFTTKTKSQGTGIGLHMTESIINKHLNGEISASNKEYKYDSVGYKGALFSINFPIDSV